MDGSIRLGYAAPDTIYYVWPGHKDESAVRFRGTWEVLHRDVGRVWFRAHPLEFPGLVVKRYLKTGIVSIRSGKTLWSYNEDTKTWTKT